MSPNLFHNNLKGIDDGKDSNLIDGVDGDKPIVTGDFVDSKGNPSIRPNDQLNGKISITMEQHNTHQHSKKLHNNVKAENLKSKIDFLIMSKTGKLNAPPAPEEEAEDIQSIQAEINNMLGGKVSPCIARPGMDVKNSKKLKSGMDLTKPSPGTGGNLHSNHHSPLHSNTSTTVEKVEHLLESMFSDNRPSPVKSMPMDCSSKSGATKKTTTPRQSLEKLSNEAIENILRTPSPVDDEADDVKPPAWSLNISNNKPPSTTKPPHTNSRNCTSSNSNNHSLDSNHLHPPSSLSSPHRPPGNVLSSPSKPPGTRYSPPGNLLSSPSKPPGMRYSGRTRKKSSLSLDDDSSSDSTKLEIVDDAFNNHSVNDSVIRSVPSDKPNAPPSPSVDRSVSSDKPNAPPSPSIQRLNRSANRVPQGGCEAQADVKSNGEMKSTNETPSSYSSAMMPSNKSTLEHRIKQEPPSRSPTTSNASPVKPTSTPSQNPVMAAAKLSVTPSKNPIMAVENELEKMFAGIVKEEEEEAPAVKLETGAAKRENGAVTDNAAVRKRRSSGERSNRRRSSEFFPSSPEHATSQSTPPKRKKKKNAAAAAGVKNNGGGKRRTGSTQGVLSHSRHSAHPGKETSNDSTTLSKSSHLLPSSSSSSAPAATRIAPFIRVYQGEHRREAGIVNSVASIRDEETGPAGVKKPAGFVPNKKMRSSAQSNLQPANRTDVLDPTWTCVLCKRGPNTCGPAGNPLGDLFGPYRIAAPQETFLDGDEFKRRVNRAGGGGTGGTKQDSVKKKRTVSTDVDSSRLTAGLVRVSAAERDAAAGSASGKGSAAEYEIWFHEACIVWGSGCYLVGSALMGLDQCVWSALNATCVNCGETGASIGCVKSKCRGAVHYSCALHIGWYLDPGTFIATCPTHRHAYDAVRYVPTRQESPDEAASVASEDL